MLSLINHYYSIYKHIVYSFWRLTGIVVCSLMDDGIRIEDDYISPETMLDDAPILQSKELGR